MRKKESVKEWEREREKGAALNNNARLWSMCSKIRGRVEELYFKIPNQSCKYYRRNYKHTYGSSSVEFIVG